MTILRVDLINYSTMDVTIEVKTEDQIVYRELLITTAANLPDETPGQTHGPGSFTLVVPAGRFFGFQTSGEVSISNPSPLVHVIAASDKDPWPQPPPVAPSTLSSTTDYFTRYKYFNRTAAHPSKTSRAVPLTIAPLRAS